MKKTTHMAFICLMMFTAFLGLREQFAHADEFDKFNNTYNFQCLKDDITIMQFLVQEGEIFLLQNDWFPEKAQTVKKNGDREQYLATFVGGIQYFLDFEIGRAIWVLGETQIPLTCFY